MAEVAGPCRLNLLRRDFVAEACAEANVGGGVGARVAFSARTAGEVAARINAIIVADREREEVDGREQHVITPADWACLRARLVRNATQASSFLMQAFATT